MLEAGLTVADASATAVAELALAFETAGVLTFEVNTDWAAGGALRAGVKVASPVQETILDVDLQGPSRGTPARYSVDIGTALTAEMIVFLSTGPGLSAGRGPLLTITFEPGGK